MVKASTVIAVGVLAVVGFLLYEFLQSSGTNIGVSPSVSTSTPQLGQSASYPSANSSASGGGLSVSEVYNYSPSTISESTNTYNTTNTSTTTISGNTGFRLF
jgi:hypothetical protein